MKAECVKKVTTTRTYHLELNEEEYEKVYQLVSAAYGYDQGGSLIRDIYVSLPVPPSQDIPF